MRIILALVVLFATNVNANDELWFDLTFASKHVGNQEYLTKSNTFERYNEVNPGFGFTLKRSSNLSFLAGTYKNSYKRQSLYAGVNFHTNNEIFNVGVATGLVSGYSLMPIMPMVLPNASVKLSDFSKIVIGVIPASLIDDGSSSAITFQFSVKLF